MKINLIEYLEDKRTSERADRIAVIDGDRTLNFGELKGLSKKLAKVLVAQKNNLNSAIAVFLPKSVESVIADTAVTYSGNIYMNLDIKYPQERLRNVLAKIQPGIIITSSNFTEQLKNLCGDDILVIDINSALQADETAMTDTELLSRLNEIIDTDPYCIINTSGSTGTPKGVVLSHRNFIDYLEWSFDKLAISENEIMGSLSPVFFDLHIYELCILMAKQATLVVLPEQYAAFPAKLLEVVALRQVNFIYWVPTIMVNIANLNLLESVPLNTIQKVIFAGEVFPTRHMNYWRRHLPQALFANLYGPIEITVECTYYIVEKEIPNEEPIPIGYPCRNTDILILNDENKLANANEKGELCVRGSSLAMGYWNDPEKTAKAFVQNPLNKKYPEIIYRTGDVVYKDEAGLIHFVGRKDFQIKHSGYRIDLGEIEHIIVNCLAGINNACVMYHTDKKEIYLYFESPVEITGAEIRKKLSEFLPKYMLPTQLRYYSELPRNPNGKIDRNFLLQQMKNESGS